MYLVRYQDVSDVELSRPDIERMIDSNEVGG